MPDSAPSPLTKPETPAEPLSRTDGVIIPLALLFLVNVVVFSALISFRLRPNVGGRMLPIMGISFAGLLAGALVFPRFADWVGTARSCGRWGWQRVLAAAWSVFALATVLPGTRQYIENEPLRYIANFAMCLSIAPAYYLFFSRFPVRRRGLWFGATEAAGIVIWLFLSYLAHGVPVSETPPHHPLLPVVYTVHAGATALAAALLLYTLVFSRTPWAGTAVAEQSISEPTSHRTTAFALLSMGFAVFFLGGILNAQLTPILVSPRPFWSEHLSIGFLMAGSALASGWLYDTRSTGFARIALAVCCWVFLTAPCLAVLKDSPRLHIFLQAVGAACQYSFYVVCTLALVKLATGPAQATLLTGVFLFMRIGSVLGLLIMRGVHETNQGVTVFIATAVAALVLFLTRRVERISVHPHSVLSSAEDRPDAPAHTAATVAEAQDRFLASAGLTPREAETARLLIEGKTTKSIASNFGISDRAVTKHMTALFRKTGVPNRRAFYAAYLKSLTGPSASENGVIDTEADADEAESTLLEEK